MFHTFFGTGFLGKYLAEAPISQTAYIILFTVSVLLCIVIAYLLGSLNFAIIISGKQYRQDIRQFGSKNAGMTNMMRTYGTKAAGLTLLGDAGKAIVACLFGYALLGQFGAYVTGLFAIIGHMFPVFFHFKGGKGVATSAAVILMCNPIVFAVLLVIFIIIVAFTKYLSLGSIMAMLLYPVILDRINKLFSGAPSPYVIFAFLMTVLVVAKHWKNIQRLLQGKENKFSFKKSVKSKESSEKSDSSES